MVVKKKEKKSEDSEQERGYRIFLYDNSIGMSKQTCKKAKYKWSIFYVKIKWLNFTDLWAFLF